MEWQSVVDSAAGPPYGTIVPILENKQVAEKKEGVEEKNFDSGCNLSNYQTATLIGPGDFPYTSGIGITVNATVNVPTLTNTTYTCNGNSFSTAPTAWWINATEHSITLTFSAPVNNFSMVVNGTNNTEVFTFTTTTGTISLSNYCTASFSVVGAGNQLQCNASGTNGTLVSINNPTGSTSYTITHNGLLAGSRITLLDCYVAIPTWYRDMDGDSFGDPNNSMMAASQPTGYVSDNTDCNDNNAAIKPGATEVCDGVDNDCDGSTDEGVQITYYRDMDGDSYGNPSNTTLACSLPTGYVTNNTDCDDNDSLERPGQVWHKDTDGDNYAQTGAATLTQCLRPAGYKVASELISTTGDCNDNNAAIKPGATEVCDGVDNDCDGSTDEGVQITYYRDMDGDSYGNPSNTTLACSLPTGYVTNNSDCDDNDSLEKPGQVWYKDTDGDNYAQTGAPTLTQCLRPAGYIVASELISTTGDCNDNNPAIKPGATEVCDGIDNNCDGSTDEGVQTTYYRDMDGDSYGNPSNTTLACSLPTGYVTNNTDCDDTDPLEKPGQTWYADVDNDGYSSGVTQISCLRPSGHKVAGELTSTTGDCNDNDEDINPAATEVCDGIDNNCDGSTDEGVLTTYYRDQDGDGFGNASITQQACSAPSGYVANNTDCNDNNALEKPGQMWYKDIDGDGYAETGAATITECARPAGYKVASELTSTTGDCNDGNAAIKPGAVEVCDGVDNDCDGLLDGNDPNFVDTTPPMVFCPNNQTLVLNASCSASLPDYRSLATANDACGTPALTQMPAPGSNVSGVGSGTVTLTATDARNNSASCTFNLSKVDQTPPSAVCRQGTVQLSGIQSLLEAEDVLDFNASTDNCGQVQVTNITPAQINCSEVGQYISVNVSVSDGNGNTASCVANLSVTKDNSLPEPWQSENIGVTALGTSEYDVCSSVGAFTLQANGYTTNTADVQHSVYQDLCGNAELIVHVSSIFPQGGWAGIQMRESDSQGARKFTIKTQLSALLRREVRVATFGATNAQNVAIPPTHTWLRITRAGNVFNAYTSTDGVNWVFRSTATIGMPGCVHVGMFVESINNTATTQAIFDNVSISGSVQPLVAAPESGPANTHPGISVEKITIFLYNYSPTRPQAR
ncbi:MAG: HYR domain-containing protein [Saprospiraceae bacterium]|nr:HYR domain-containing protein [Saprospiraceae bacterium]